jgi:gamma-glutamyltranspeptidase/glutathione hydrolase
MTYRPPARAAFIAVALVFLFAGIAEARAAGPGKAAIASAYPLASEAGHEVLRRGGNAFDAAVAVSAALAVVEPYGSGVTGGGFYLLHRAADGRQVVVDAREMAPGAATRDMYLDRDGNVVEGASTDTALAGGIPGEPAAWAHLAEKYGRLPLSVSLEPAIRLARDGFPVYERLHAGLAAKAEALRRSPDAARIFLVKGEAPPVGHRLRQRELARVLEAVARQGAKGFYTGPVARQLVAGVRAGGGIWSEEDLARYRVIEREPVVGEYHGARIVSIPPPSSGGVALIDSLNILSGFDLKAVDGVTRRHLVIEAMRRAFRDRAEYLGDPAFVQVPVERLVNPYYAAGQRASIRADRATPSSALPGIADDAGGMHTTHFSVIDAEGNRVAATQSLNLWFGTAWVIPGTGLLLNNTMDDFSVKPGVPNAYQLVGAAANAVAPYKRPLSSMTPTFVEAPQGLMIAGSPGGSFIISMVLLGTLNWLDGMSPADVVAAPRYHHQFLPDSVMFEPGALSAEERAGLEKKGHSLSEATEPWGNLQVVTWDYASGRVEAASDPRGVGVGFVY